MTAVAISMALFYLGLLVVAWAKAKGERRRYAETPPCCSDAYTCDGRRCGGMRDGNGNYA